MPPKLYLPSFCLLFLLVAVTANAQELPDTLQLEPVEIRATRTKAVESEVPAALMVLEQSQVQELQATVSLDEVLRRVPGVFVSNRYNLSQGERISIRGLGSRAQFGVRSIKVLLDGIPLTFPDGTTQLNNLDLGWIGRMEVLRGPASTLYGNAAGGVIYLQSEVPEPQSLTVEPKFIAGSYGLFKEQLTLKAQRGNTSLLLSADRTDYSGFREFSTSRLYHINSVLRHYLSDRTSLTWVLNLMHAPFMLNPSSLTREDAEERPQMARDFVQQQVAGKRVSQGQSGLTLRTQVGQQGEVSSTLYGIGRDLYNPIPGAVIDLERWSGGWRNVYERPLELPNSTLNLTAGVDIEYQTDQRREYENPGVSEEVLAETPPVGLLDRLEPGRQSLAQRERVLSSGLFSVLSWKWKEKLVLTTGLRYDWYRFTVAGMQQPSAPQNTEFSQLSPSVGVLYHLSEKLKPYVNFSTAFQTPTANEFSNDPSGGAFNTQLRPERLHSIEAGLRKQGRKLRGELTGFYFEVRNQLIPYQLSGQSDITYYRNAGQASNRGLELWLEYAPQPWLALTVSYTYMHYVFDDYVVESDVGRVQLAGNRVPGVPAHNLFMGLRVQHHSGVKADMNVRWVGEYFASDFNGPPPGTAAPVADFINEGYWLADLRLGYEWEWNRGSITLFGGINNLLDIRYNGSITPNAFGNRFFEPAPGRSYYAGVSVPLHL